MSLTTKRSANGINPKAWFYNLRTRLQQDDVKIVLAGAKCEQWFNSELFKVVVQGLGKELTAYTELGKRDVSILACPGEETAQFDWKKPPLAVIETKLLYFTSYDHKAALEKLEKQLLKQEESLELRMGLVLGVFRDWRGRDETKTREDFKEFRANVRKQFDSFSKESSPQGFSIVVDHSGSMETIVDLCFDNKIGGRNVPVALIGQYVVFRRNDLITPEDSPA
jgi:hypothetical protein